MNSMVLAFVRGCRLIGYCSLWLLGASCAHHGHLTLTRQQLESSLSSVKAWPRSAQYSQEDWNRLLTVAGMMQKCDGESVQVALREYQASYADNGVVVEENDSKLYLLLRVVFSLPERSFGGRMSTWGWVTDGTQYSADGTVNLAWPLSWKGGRPKLLAGDEGIEGLSDRYDARTEYAYFSVRYPMRRLVCMRE